MIGYHVTTEKKAERYKKTGCILARVNFFSDLSVAKRWARKKGRNLILRFECTFYHPHRMHEFSYWTPENVYKYVAVNKEDQ